jgi:hypothetical protein
LYFFMGYLSGVDLTYAAGLKWQECLCLEVPCQVSAYVAFESCVLIRQPLHLAGSAFLKSQWANTTCLALRLPLKSSGC